MLDLLDDDGDEGPSPTTVEELCKLRPELRIRKQRRADGAKPQLMLQLASTSLCIAFDTLAHKKEFYSLLCSTSHIGAGISAVEMPCAESVFPFYVRCTDLPRDVEPLLFGAKVSSIVAKHCGQHLCRHTISVTEGRTVELVFPDLLVGADQAAIVVMHLSAELPSDDPPNVQKEYRWHERLSPRCFAPTRTSHNLYLYVPNTAAFEVCSSCLNRSRDCSACNSTGHVLSEERTRRLLAIASPGQPAIRFDEHRRPTCEELMLTSLTRALDEPVPDASPLQKVEGMPFVPGASSNDKKKPAGRLWGKKKAFTPVPDGIILILQGIVRRTHPMWSRQIVTTQSVRKLSRSWIISQRGMNVHFFPACRRVHEQVYASLRICPDGSYAPCPICGLTPQKKSITNRERTALFPDGNYGARDLDEAISLEDRVIASVRARRDRGIKKKRSVFGFPKPLSRK